MNSSWLIIFINTHIHTSELKQNDTKRNAKQKILLKSTKNLHHINQSTKYGRDFIFFKHRNILSNSTVDKKLGLTHPMSFIIAM